MSGPRLAARAVALVLMGALLVGGVIVAVLGHPVLGLALMLGELPLGFAYDRIVTW